MRQMKRELFATMLQMRNQFDNNLAAIESELQLVLNKEFDAHVELQEAIAKLENEPEGYQFRDYGDIVSYVSFTFSKFPINEHVYLETYLADRGYHASVAHSRLMQWQGTDNYLIQAYSGPDNGVWQNGKKVIEVEEFVTDGQEDLNKLRSLIEHHMEGAGVYPNVFWVTHNGGLKLETFKQVK